MAGPADRFTASLAVVVGVDTYTGDGIPRLACAVSDARAVAACLEGDHGFEVLTLYDEEATAARLLRLLEVELPARIDAGARVLFYFAGHGVALDADHGLAGYLLLHDARRADPGTFLPMPALHDALTALPCRHCLIVLDCCFAGTFRWSSLRDLSPSPAPMYSERYERFLDSPAWQVLTSAASDQPALDRLEQDRGEAGLGHSPFAAALLDGLSGAADYNGDGVVTASELALYLRDRVESALDQRARRQTPQLFLLNKHARGEFVFQAPGRDILLPSAPELRPEESPYRGLASFEEGDAALFFGREAAVEELLAAVERQPLTVVAGPSGAGKSSLVKAGLLPRLREAGGTRVLAPRRPGRAPLACLRGIAEELERDAASPDRSPAEAFAASLARATAGGDRVLVVIDQLEELVTLRDAPGDAEGLLEALGAGIRGAPSLRVVVTVRADVEPQFLDGPLGPSWAAGRHVVRPMTRAELRAAVEHPATAFVMFFEPPALVERLVDDVALLPAPLPLLSFALSELYRCYWERRGEDRSLREADYDRIGGVAGALTRRAEAIHGELAQASGLTRTLRNVLMRMVSDVAGDLARRRVPRSSLVYEDDAENARVALVIERLHAARLISLGLEPAPAGGDDVPYAEPTHDELVRGWPRMLRWLEETKEQRVLVRALGPAVEAWWAHRRSAYLWNADPRLPQASAALRSPEGFLNREEAAFVRQSVRRRLRGLATLWAAVGFTVAVLAVATFAALRSAEKERLAAAEAKRAQAEAVDNQKRELGQRATVTARQPGQGCAGVILAINAALPFAGSGRELPIPVVQGLVDGVRNAWCATWVLSHEGAVRRVAFSPDGGRLLTVSGDHDVGVWDLSTGRRALDLRGHAEMVLAAAFSRDGRRIATGGSDRTAILWDAASGVEIERLAPWTNNVSEIDFSPAGSLIALAGVDGAVRLWRPDSGAEPELLRAHTQPVLALQFSGDGARLLSAGWDGAAIVWDVAARRPVSRLDDSPRKRARDGGGSGGRERVTVPTMTVGALNHATFSPDGATFAIVGREGLTVAAADTGERLLHAPSGDLSGAEVGLSPDGSRVATVGYDATVRLWETASKRPLKTLTDHTDTLNSLCFTPGGSLLATAGDDRVPRVWDAHCLRLLARLPGHSDRIHQIRCASRDGDLTLATASADRTSRVWSWNRGRALTVLPAPSEMVLAMAFSRDASLLAVGTSDQVVRLWDVASGRLIRGLQGHQGSIRSIATSPSDRRVLTTSDDRTARVWDLASAAELRRLRVAPEDDYRDLFATFVDDDTVLVSSDQADLVRLRVGSGEVTWLRHGDEDGVEDLVLVPGRPLYATMRLGGVALRDTATGLPVRMLAGHQGAVRHVRLTRDGARAVTAGDDAYAVVWDVDTGARLLTLDGHAGGITAVSFSPDERILLTGGKDRTVRLWDARTGAALRTLTMPSATLDAAMFLDEGRLVFAGSYQGTMTLWDAATGARLAAFGDRPDDFGDVVASPRGDLVALASQSGSVEILPASGTGLLRAACRALHGVATDPSVAADFDEARRGCEAMFPERRP